MRKHRNFKNPVKEELILERDELGWEAVYREGKFYYKKTLVKGNATIQLYLPIPFEEKKTIA